jgi:hypothetical protein
LNASRSDDSFPYLHLSRRLRLPYGTVLAYVEMLDSNPVTGLQRDLVDALDEADLERIMDVWRQEKVRQVRAAWQT